MSEYPKVIDVDGQKITATSADDETFWRTRPEAPPINALEPDPEPKPEPQPEPPAVVEPPKKKAKKGKVR